MNSPSTGRRLNLPLGPSSPMMGRMHHQQHHSNFMTGGGSQFNSPLLSMNSPILNSPPVASAAAAVASMSTTLPLYNGNDQDDDEEECSSSQASNSPFLKRRPEIRTNYATDILFPPPISPRISQRTLPTNDDVGMNSNDHDSIMTGEVQHDGANGQKADVGVAMDIEPTNSNNNGSNNTNNSSSNGTLAIQNSTTSPKEEDTTTMPQQPQPHHNHPNQQHENHPHNRPHKSQIEKEAQHKWHQECREHELSCLDETRQNVRLLLQQRRRQREFDQQRRIGTTVRQPVNFGDGGNDVATSNNTSTSPPSSTEGSSNTAVPESRRIRLNAFTTTDSTNNTADDQTRDQNATANKCDIEVDNIELLDQHRRWCFYDGRLIVLKSLPHMSLHDGVVAIPIGTTAAIAGAASFTLDGNHHHNQRCPITISPGCIVMAEESFTLDSHSLRVIHPSACSTGAVSPAARENNNSSPTSTLSTNQNCIQILKISCPHEGYIVSKLHNYPYLAPGLPSTYTNANHWFFRVTCQPDGAFIRKGLELIAPHVNTLPYGSFCRVQKKVVNSMGLNRLEIDGYLERSSSEGKESSNGNNNRERDVDKVERSTLLNLITGRNEENNGDCEGESTINGNHVSSQDQSPEDNSINAFGMTKVSGWISEFLNPLSGQRGPVVASVPFPCPALYRVTFPEGVVIRSGVELSTSQIGYAPSGSILSIVGRAYSDHPRHHCIERLRLAGGGGWISSQLNKEPPNNQQLVEMIDIDGSFDPDNPASFHFEAQRKVMQELEAPNNDVSTSGRERRSTNSIRPDTDANTINANGGFEGIPTFHRQRSLLGADLSEINEDDWTDRQSSMSDSDDAMPAESSTHISPPNAAATVPTLFRSGAASGLGMSGMMRGTVGSAGGTSGHASSSHSETYHHHPHQNRCLICLSDERTATIVHGETGHIACCLTCARILKARGDNCPVCRLPIDLVIQQFWA